MKTNQQTAREGLSFLGVNLCEKGGPKLENDGFMIDSSAVLTQTLDTLYYNKYACYFVGCRKTYECVQSLTSHYKIHVSA